MDEQRKWFLEMESTSGEAVLKIVDMRTKDWESYKNLVDRAAAESEGIDSILKEVLLWVKFYLVVLHTTEKSFVKGRVNQCGKLHCYLILRNCHSYPNLQQLLPWSLSSHQHQGRALHEQKDYNSLEAQMMVSIFSSNYF